MEPQFRAWDVVAFSPNSEARNGDFVLARLRADGAVLFKQFHREGKNGGVVRLVSLNPNYDQTEHSAESFRFVIPGVSGLSALKWVQNARAGVLVG
jgi:phage repressor protein C with HTH and peptisase S24 domain